MAQIGNRNSPPPSHESPEVAFMLARVNFNEYSVDFYLIFSCKTVEKNTPKSVIIEMTKKKELKQFF